jgi:hypothetical protein
MIKVYICEDCAAEVPYSETLPETCHCGAEKDSWVVAEKPEPRCGGESR